MNIRARIAASVSITLAGIASLGGGRLRDVNVNISVELDLDLDLNGAGRVQRS